jgi:1,6-anhydro-N-acetylmuramate kinase
MAFANRISAVPLRRAQRTSISGAIDFSVKLLEQSGVEASRQVIDVSGDGPNNQGRLVTPARDEAVAKGITINGLPIMLRKPGYLDIVDLDFYYRDCVIGGQGAFMVPAREREQFQQAIKTKIMLEVAGLMPEHPLVQRAQTAPPTNCLVGETQWRDRMGN